MAIPVSASINQLNAEVFLQEGYELSLDAIIPSIELTGSFSPTTSKTQFYLYNYSKTLLYQNLNYNANGSFLPPESGTTISNSTSSYNQFELNPIEDIYNQGYSSGNYYAVYNFIDYELGSELIQDEQNELFNGHPYFLSEISGDRTELRIQNNFLSTSQILTYYNQFNTKINARENADEFYISFGDNRNFIAVNSQLETPTSGSSTPTSILIKLYKPLPIEFQVDQQLQIISKVGETLVFSVDFQPNLEFVDNLLQLKGPNYNIDLKDKINNSTNYKNFNDLVNTATSESYYQFNSLRDQKGIFLRKNWGDWSEFVKYSSAEQRLRNFKDKLSSIESSSAELLELENITGGTSGSSNYSSSYNRVSNNINQIISKFDSYEYFLYYVTGSESWPKFTSTYPYTNFSVTSSEALNWFGSTDETDLYYNTGKNQVYSASRYDNDNQDYLYYLIPPYITDNSSNNQYIKFVNMTGQAFDEAYLYTEAVEQVRNTNSGLTGSVLPLGLADDVVESLGFNVGGNTFNSIDFNPNNVGVYPITGSGLEYISHYVDIASGSIINYYDQQQSTLGYVIALADPSFPYPLENSSQEIYKRIFHNMVSLVKRKGTVTGLRQLINIWGVPNTMLRISEFGGKNKDDENDYDLWMNRYSTAIKTYSGSLVKNTPSTLGTQASSSVLIPWTPLTSNFYDGSAPSDYFSAPDSIQFRFKNKKPIGPDQFFTSSLLIKPWFDGAGGNIPNSPGAFALVLEYSGSNSGSFNGSVLPTDSQYGTLQLVMSGSVSDGATEGTLNSGRHYFTSPKISLPFFDDGWWSVQLQRSTNISASTEDNTLNEFELKVANNIYDGYDGNQIGFQGSTSIQMLDGKVSSSMNTAWNNMFFVNADNSTTSINKRALILGGLPFDGDYGSGNNVIMGGGSSALKAIMKVGGKFIGRPFVGEFQEFRYYRRAVSGSSFNDYVMNPESIQGQSNTGAGSSYDLLSYRISLGNELEYINSPIGAKYDNFATGNYGNTKNQFRFGLRISNPAGTSTRGIGSIHPSIVNSTSTLFTSSFIEYRDTSLTRDIFTSSYYSWDIATAPDNQYITASWISPNTELNYMDQPSAGIRNRIKNKIQVIDGNEYGTILSPYRSIQQEFEQSSSYTEDLNSLEVGFSFQNEINDDIISTFGHGVVSDAIADPRFYSASSDRYPELTRIAEDYFKKYQGFSVDNDVEPNSPTTLIEKEYDYNRLIKFYETSLFKAIKNYVPARTSLSTGIIVKQHLLERNKASSTTGISINTPIAKTPETGSDVYGYTDQTGFNSIISQRNLLITSSIVVGSLTGSAGGSVNKYNIITNEGQFYKNVSSVTRVLPAGSMFDLYNTLPPANSALNIKIATALDSEGKVFQQSEVAFRSQLRWKPSFTAAPGNPTSIRLEATSSKRGGIFSTEFPYGTSTASPPAQISNNFIEIYPNERIYWRVGSTDQIVTMNAYIFQFGESVEFTKPEPKTSQQVNWYIDDFTGEYKVDDHQTEFYNGEYSGSNVPMIPAQYNPYRIFADGNDKTPDITLPFINMNLGGGDPDYWEIISSDTIQVKSGYPSGGNIFKYWTGSIHNLTPGETYILTYTVTNESSGFSDGIVFNDPTPGSTSWNGFTAITSNGTFTETFVATDNKISGIGDSGGVFMSEVAAGKTVTVQFNSIVGIGSLGPKHFYKNDGFTITPSSSWLFQNSPYNPIINNVSGSRINERFLDMDFDPVPSGSSFIEGIPNDYQLTVSSSQLGWEGTATADALLEYSQVPESNYTILSSTNPRYNGSLLESADYNFYTGIPSQSKASITLLEKGRANTPVLFNQNKVRYANDETGSWRGDVSYGKTAVIDRNPIYFAHFKSSIQSRETFNSTTFNIDQLIQVPFEDITGQQSPLITSSLINGNNSNVIPVSTTFMPGRKLAVSYNNPSKTFTFGDNSRFKNTSSLTINYTELGVGTQEIYASAVEFQSKHTNQINESNITVTQSFTNPSWYKPIRRGSGVNNSTNFQTGSFTELITQQRYPNAGSYLDTDNVWNGNFAYLYNKIQSSGSSDSTLFNPLKINQVVQGGNNVSLGISTFRPNLLGEIVNLQNPWAFLTQSIGPMNAEGIEKGYGLLELGGTIGTIQGIGEWDFYLPPGGATNYSSSLVNLCGKHLQVLNTLNTAIKNGDVIPNNDSASYTFEPPYAIGLGGIFLNTSPLAASSTNLQDNITGSGKSPFVLPVLSEEERADDKNYFQYNYIDSFVGEYKNFSKPFIIERGDEIRVTYTVPQDILFEDGATTQTSKTLTQKTITQDFTVLGYRLPAPQMRFPSPVVTNQAGSQGVPANGQICLATSSTLPPEGIYSQDSMFKRYETMISNSIPILGSSELGGVNSVSNSEDSVFSGSLTGVTRIGAAHIGISFEVHGSPPLQATSLTSSYTIGTTNNMVRTGLCAPLYLNEVSASMGPVLQAQLSNPDIPFIGGLLLWRLTDPAYNYTMLEVTPDPATLKDQIPNGIIHGYTIKKRIPADDRVVVNLQQPSGSRGQITPSGDGYLIPNDLTEIQQGNVQKLINKLKSENVFTEDTSNNSIR